MWNEKEGDMSGHRGLRTISVGQNFEWIMETLSNTRKMHIEKLTEEFVNVNNKIRLYFERKKLIRITNICTSCGKVEDVSNKQYKTGICRECRRNKRKQEQMLSCKDIYSKRNCSGCDAEFIPICKYNHYCEECHKEIDNHCNFKHFKNYKEVAYSTENKEVHYV